MIDSNIADTYLENHPETGLMISVKNLMNRQWIVKFMVSVV
jgi:hypothetical protein